MYIKPICKRIDDPAVFGLLGAQLFGGKFNASSRANFNSFQKSYLAVFQVVLLTSRYSAHCTSHATSFLT